MINARNALAQAVSRVGHTLLNGVVIVATVSKRSNTFETSQKAI